MIIHLGKPAVLLLTICCIAAGPATKPVAEGKPQPEMFDKVKNAPANSWVAIPNSALMGVAPKEGKFPKTWGICGPSSVVSAWCGAAFDSKRQRLVVWGGGHADYHGNEIYVFDVKQMVWQRLNDPFADPVNDQEVNADGSANSRHTYGGLAYITHADRFFGLGGSLAGKGFAKCDRTWTYDFEAGKWEDRQPGGALPGGGFCLGCAYDPASRLLYLATGRGLFAYDYDKNSWQRLDAAPADGKGYTIDPKRKLLVGVGNGSVFTYDISQKKFEPAVLKLPGAAEVVTSGNAAGVDYDPVGDRIVCWASWAPDTVFALDLDAKKWEMRRTENPPKAPANAGNGVFGRWRYVSSVNAFIAVGGATGDVYFYKNTVGAP